jgi:Ca2+/Na+ antiporter
MKKRLQGAVGIWIIMAILTFAKVGNNYIANIVDTAAGIFLFLPIVFVLFSGNFEEKEQKLMELEEEMQDKRPKCSQKQKIAWFFYWILLIIVQLGILAIQMPMLPSLK